MAFHKGITSAYFALAAGAIAQSVQRTRSVEISEVPGADGEYAKASPLRQMKTEVSISGVGPANLGGIAAGNVDPTSTLKLVSIEQGEKSSGDNRATFSLQAVGYTAFDESAVGTPDDAGAGDPDEDTLGIVAVTLALSETFSQRREIKDLIAPATDGSPGARAMCGIKNTFSVRGKGDVPASLTLGFDGIEVAGIATGKTIVRQIMDDEKSQEINGWGAEANNYPAAA